jgi:hypothetical protein
MNLGCHAFDLGPQTSDLKRSNSKDIFDKHRWRVRPKSEVRGLKPALLALSAIFRDVHDLVLKDEQIGRALARQAHHIFVVIFNPSVEDLPVQQLDRDRFLLFPQRFKKRNLFERIFRRRRPASLGGIGIPLWGAERHAGIVHKA